MTSSASATAHVRHSRLAFLAAVPIAVLGGLIGLGVILIVSAVRVFNHGAKAEHD